MKMLLAAVLTTAFIALPAPPVAAGEIPEDVVARSSETPISSAQAKRLTKYLLGRLIGPSVANELGPMKVSAWGCLEQGDTVAACFGSVRAGTVLCRGKFKVYKFPETYRAFPLQMDCGVPD